MTPANYTQILYIKKEKGNSWTSREMLAFVLRDK